MVIQSPSPSKLCSLQYHWHDVGPISIQIQHVCECTSICYVCVAQLYSWCTVSVNHFSTNMIGLVTRELNPNGPSSKKQYATHRMCVVFNDAITLYCCCSSSSSKTMGSALVTTNHVATKLDKHMSIKRLSHDPTPSNRTPPTPPPLFFYYHNYAKGIDSIMWTIKYNVVASQCRYKRAWVNGISSSLSFGFTGTVKILSRNCLVHSLSKWKWLRQCFVVFRERFVISMLCVGLIFYCLDLPRVTDAISVGLVPCN